MQLHEIFSNIIINILDNVYYTNLKKIYNDTVGNLFRSNNYTIIRPEFFLYSQFYFIYTSLYYKNLIMYSLSIHLTYISNNIYNKLLDKYEYNPSYNFNFLNNCANLFLIYLYSLKIMFLKINFLKRVFILLTLSGFYLLININYIYKERLKYIKLKEDFRHPLKIFIISPSKTFIESVIKNTNYFTYINFLFLLNIIIYSFS